MVKVEVFDPPMCCETGVCGPEIDPALPRFAADLEWLRTRGIAVERFNLAQDPSKFVARTSVKDTLVSEGNECLPLILVDGQIASRGSYPDRDILASYVGIAGEGEANKDLAQASQGRSIPVVQTQGCCSSGDGESSCC